MNVLLCAAVAWTLAVSGAADAEDLWGDTNLLTENQVEPGDLVLLVPPDMGDKDAPEKTVTAGDKAADTPPAVRAANEWVHQGLIARVADVRENGDVVLFAERRLIVGEKELVLRFSGVVADKDISPSRAVPFERAGELRMQVVERELPGEMI
jgi:hypothetical protein